MKICFVSSSGGHWEELMCLEEIARQHQSFYVTEKGGQSQDARGAKIYLLSQINREEKLFLLHFIWVVIRACAIMCKERPDIVISTGALIAYPFCLVGKMLGKRIIYIESFARVHNASLTGKLVYKFADLFIVQWKSMLEKYPKATYLGGIF